MVATEKMVQDLTNWMPLMMTIALGAGFAFNILAPNYHLNSLSPDSQIPLRFWPDNQLDLSTGARAEPSFLLSLEPACTVCRMPHSSHLSALPYPQLLIRASALTNYEFRWSVHGVVLGALWLLRSV